MNTIGNNQTKIAPVAPKPPDAQKTKALIDLAERDMFKAMDLDGRPGDQDPRTGVVDIPARLGQQAYTRFFEGDTRQGNICEDARKMTEFDGNQVKITYNTSIEVDGRLGTDAEWFLMDRTQPGKSTSGVERTFMEICE